MLTSLRIFFFYLTTPIVLLGLLLFFALDNRPLVKLTSHNQLTQQDIQRARHILNSTKPSQHNLTTLSLTEKDLNIALNYLLNRNIKSSSYIHLDDDLVNFNISLLIPGNHFFGHFLNFRFKLIKNEGYPSISALIIGKIKIADEFAGLIIENIIKHSPLQQYYILATQHIRNIQINAHQINITYHSDGPPTTEIFAQTVTNPALVIYQQKIVDIVNEHDSRWRLSIADLMQPLFKLAYQRSTPETAIDENRSVIFALSSYINKKDIQAYLPLNLITDPVKQHPAFMYQRIDMSKHFIASAALTATGVGVIAQMLGQEKELRDAQSGSGFSFIDLAGDRAGMYFGQYATSSAKNARQLQLKMSQITSYRAFMPDVTDLPENMNEQQFKSRFGSVYSQAYQNMLKVIDKRVSRANIYQ